MIDQILNNTERVTSLLTNQPELRDNDNRLIAVFWAYEIGVDNLHDMSASDLLGMLSNGKLTNSETIRRARQKVQEGNTNLRGRNYKGRKILAEEVRLGINEKP
jgi:hypothetical protein